MDTLNLKLILLIAASAAIGWILATGKSKTQWVRLVDIFIYGPFLIFIGLHRTYTFSTAEKIFLMFFGASTVTYNLRNYLGSRSKRVLF